MQFEICKFTAYEVIAVKILFQLVDVLFSQNSLQRFPRCLNWARFYCRLYGDCQESSVHLVLPFLTRDTYGSVHVSVS